MATIEFKLPNLGENIDSGDVVKVLVAEGDQIAAEQAIVELETGKATVEIPCPHAGKISKVHIAEGDTVPIGGVLVTIDPDAQGTPASKTTEKPAEASKKKAEPPKAAAADEDEDEGESVAAPAKRSTASTNGGLSRPAKSAPKPLVAEVVSGGAASPAGPSTRRLARELGVDLQRVAGTGPGGRITREDIIAAVRQSNALESRNLGVRPGRAPALPDGVDVSDNWGKVRRVKMTRTRKTIAANMARSLEIPMVTNFDDADVTELEKLRKESVASFADADIKLTMMAFVMKAVAQALRSHPAMNASLDLEAEQVVYKDYVNLGVAVDTERGLVVPVIRDVDRLSVAAIAADLMEVANQVRNGKFSLEDTSGASFTISNMGAIGGTYSTPIINPPEVAILLVGRSRKLPTVVDNDRIEPRLQMPLSLSYDHRLIDGATAARFMNEVKEYLQTPGRLLIAG